MSWLPIFWKAKDIRSNETIEKHADWVETFRDQYTFTEENVEDILQQEIGKVFVKVLEDAGVYKCTEEAAEKHLTDLLQVYRI